MIGVKHKTDWITKSLEFLSEDNVLVVCAKPLSSAKSVPATCSSKLRLKMRRQQRRELMPWVELMVGVRSRSAPTSNMWQMMPILCSMFEMRCQHFLSGC